MIKKEKFPLIRHKKTFHTHKNTKAIYHKLTAKTILNGGELKVFPSYPECDMDVHFSHFYMGSTGIFRKANGERKKGNQS